MEKIGIMGLTKIAEESMVFCILVLIIIFLILALGKSIAEIKTYRVAETNFRLESVAQTEKVTSALVGSTMVMARMEDTIRTAVQHRKV